MNKTKQNIETITSYLLRLTREKFFGKVVIGLHKGRMTTVKTESVRRIEDIRLTDKRSTQVVRDKSKIHHAWELLQNEEELDER